MGGRYTLKGSSDRITDVCGAEGERADMIKAVIFDIDNTMYNFDESHKSAMAALCAYTEKNFGMDADETKKLAAKCMGMIIERLGDNCAAIHNRLIRFQCFLEQIGSADYQKAMEMYHTYWDTLLDVMEPEPGLLPLLKRLKEKGIKIGIGSDMTAYIQYKKLEKIGALGYLDFIVTSEEAGAEKPAPQFFELCVKKAGCRPEECVFIGDNLKKDVEGSARFGMAGTWYHPGKGPSDGGSDYPVIRSFEDYLHGEGWERE